MNINDILVIISECFSAVSRWLISILDSIPGAFELIICGFGVFFSSRFLLRPLFGGAGSDRVARFRIKSKDGDR